MHNRPVDRIGLFGLRRPTDRSRYRCSIGSRLRYVARRHLLRPRPKKPTTYGVTDFEATGSAEAYPVFLRGLLQLHNFEFEDSRETFREAQEIDPDFYMAYWGEALTQKQPLWNREDLAAGRAALAKLAPTPEEQLANSLPRSVNGRTWQPPTGFSPKRAPNLRSRRITPK